MSPTSQTMVAISVMKLWLWKLGQGHQNLISYWSCPIYIWLQICNIPSNGPWGNMQTNNFWFKFGGLSLEVTLKIRSRSPKPIQLFIMSKCYIYANLVKIRHLVHEILCTQAPFGKFGSLSPAVTLKNRSWSPKQNQLFIVSQCYIHANLVEICQPVHEIWCTQALFGLNFAV